MLKFVVLNEVSLDSIAEAWNLCWHHYAKTPTFTVKHLIAFLFVHKISLPYSVGLIVHDKLIGFSLLGTNEEEGWIGSFGITPKHRGKGLSKMLLDYQLALTKQIGLKLINLEVRDTNFVLKVYQSFGFHKQKELPSYLLLKKDLFFLDIYRYDKYCYRRVGADQYFSARNKQGAEFNWKRREYILKNYKKSAYYVGPGDNSGFVIQNGTALGDIWALSDETARSVLSYVSEQLESISINMQNDNNISNYLEQRSIQPISIHYEMVRMI